MKPRIAIPVPTSGNAAYNEQNWPEFGEAVRCAGGEAVRFELGLDRVTAEELARGCDGVLLPGSPADVAPEMYGQTREAATAERDEARERTDALLLEVAERFGRPVLAVCFGMQMMNVWCGGTLVQDLAPVPVNHSAGRGVAVAHFADVIAGTRLHTLAAPAEGVSGGKGLRLGMNSSHHQAVGIVGSGLRVSSWSAEDGVIEAIEAVGGERFVLGVQWHPERSVSTSATSRALFSELIGEAAAASARLSRRAGSTA